MSGKNGSGDAAAPDRKPRKAPGRDRVRQAIEAAPEIESEIQVASAAQDAQQERNGQNGAGAHDATAESVCFPEVRGFHWKTTSEDVRIFVGKEETVIKGPPGLYGESVTNSKYPYFVAGLFNVIAEGRNEDNEKWSLLVTFKDRDGVEKRLFAPRRIVTSEGGELRAMLADAGLSLGGHAAARTGLTKYFSEVVVTKRVRTVQRTGWYHSSRSGGVAFVLPDRTIGNAIEEIILDTEEHTSIYQTRGDLEAWKAAFASRCNGNTMLLFSVSCGFAGAILPLLREEGGGFHLVGSSSTGKTTLLAAASSLWGAPPTGEVGVVPFTRTWSATAMALENIARTHSHTLLPLDEINLADPKTIGDTAYRLVP